MVDWKWLVAAGVVAAALLAGWTVWDRARLLDDPRRLFLMRCSTCHKLPDLSQFRGEDMNGIVRTMRVKNGADKVISEAEAEVITRYLEETAGI